MLSIVSVGLSLAEWHYWIDENPAESATMPSPGDHEPGGPTLEQAAALLASTTPPRKLANRLVGILHGCLKTGAGFGSASSASAVRRAGCEVLC